MRFVACIILLLSTLLMNGQFLLQDEGAIVGYVLKNTATGELETGNNGHQRLISASLLKVVTTATALELLGPDYVFSTTIGYSGFIENGVLNGCLIIKPGYDPTMGSAYFEMTKPEIVFQNIKEAVLQAGINSIHGEIRIFKEQQEVPFSSPRLWEDMGNYYGGIPHAFNWCDNTCVITFQSGNVGDTCVIKEVEPDFSPYHLKSEVVGASHDKDSAYVYGVSNIKDWWVEGSIPAHRNDFTVKAAMPNPEEIFIRQLKSFLIDEGMSVSPQQSANESVVPINWFYKIDSPTLAEIIRVTNHKSNNLFADALLLTMGREKAGMVGWDEGLQVVRAFWKNKIDFENNFRLKDGSGLSPKNLVTPEGVADVLLWMKQHSEYFDVFKASLATGGESGTLKSVFKAKGVKGNIAGKSGSMEGVLGYCGYMKLKEGKELAFCVIANNFIIPFRDVRAEVDNFISSYFFEK